MCIHSILNSRKETVDRTPERILIHKNYDDESLEYDIALMKINRCFMGKCYKFSSHIQPIALPRSQLCQKQKKVKKRKGKRPKKKRKNKRSKEKRNPWLVGRKALITGWDISWLWKKLFFKIFRWGLDEEDGKHNHHLHQIHLKILSNKECKKQFKSVNLSKKNNQLSILCRKDSCDGRKLDEGSDQHIKNFMLCAGVFLLLLNCSSAENVKNSRWSRRKRCLYRR